MTHELKCPYPYSKKVVENWNSNATGVYYCGSLRQDRKLNVLYVGKGTGSGGIRSRLLDHLRLDYWPDVTHFGYIIFDRASEAETFESQEILRCKPKYNTQGK